MFKPGDRIKWVNPTSWNKEFLGKTEVVVSTYTSSSTGEMMVVTEKGDGRYAYQFVLAFDLKTLLKTYYEKDSKVL